MYSCKIPEEAKFAHQLQRLRKKSTHRHTGESRCPELFKNTGFRIMRLCRNTFFIILRETRTLND
jgi:hypothetical protein